MWAGVRYDGPYRDNAGSLIIEGKMTVPIRRDVGSGEVSAKSNLSGAFYSAVCRGTDNPRGEFVLINIAPRAGERLIKFLRGRSPTWQRRSVQRVIVRGDRPRGRK